jgi:hypothetical protein
VLFKIIGLDYAAYVTYVFCAENNACRLLLVSDGMLVSPYGVTYAELISLCNYKSHVARLLVVQSKFSKQT